MSSRAEPRPVVRRASQDVAAQELIEAHPAGAIVACDFYVSGAEQGEPVTAGFRIGRILNVDHHAPVPRMERHVSSTTLALAHVAEGGALPGAGDVVVINHTDCDSVLSSALLLGLLPASSRLDDAAIAADHTGAEDALADALQAVDELRDYELSLAVARAVLGGRAVPAPAQEHLRRRERARKLAESLARKAQVENGVALIVSDEATDGEFFPRYLPDAEVLVIACPHPDDPARRAMKLRLGAVAGTPPLHRLGMASFDRAYGGRWNAGSNKRGGGCTMDPEAYAAEVRRLLVRARSAAS